MEAVTGQTAGGVAFVGGLGAASALVCVPGLSILVFANKDNIVVLGGLINKTAIGKGVQHILIDPPLPEQIGIDPAHIVVLLRKLERCCWV